MRTRDEVLREFGSAWRTTATDAMADRIRELEAQQAASEPVAWALMRGDVPVDGFPPTFALPTDAFELQRVFRAEFVPLYAHPSAAADSRQSVPSDYPSAAAVTVTEAMVDAAARRGRDYGFNAYCDNAQEYWAAMESVLTAALTRPTTPTRGSDE